MAEPLHQPSGGPPPRASSGRIKTPTLVRRQRAIAAVQAKYGGRGFDWKAKATCLHLARFHLRMMGKRPPALPAIGSLLAAKRALAARGWADVGEMLDALRLKRIAPAAAWLGDLAMVRSEDGMGSIFVLSPPRKMIGWATDQDELALVDIEAPENPAGVWRV